MAVDRIRRLFSGRRAFAVAPPTGELALADPRYGWMGWLARPWLIATQGFAVIDQMRRDDQVRAALTLKKLAALASGWEVVSPDGAPDPWPPRDFVEWCLLHVDHGEPGGTFDADLIEMLSALEYGFSVLEKVYEPIESGDWAGYIRLRSLKSRRPHDIEFRTDPYGNLTQIIQRNNPQGTDLPREKFVIFIHGGEFENWYGTSDLEAAFYPWWLKTNALKWWGMYLERWAIPWLFAFYDPSTMTPEQAKDFVEFIRNIQASTQAAIPRSAPGQVEFWTPPPQGRTTSEFGPALDALDKRIARAILMPGLIGLGPEEAVGSFARAKVHFDVFLMVVEYLRHQIEVVVNHQIVRPLVDLNFPGGQYPQWRLKPLTDEVRLDLLDRWLDAVGAGVVVPTPEDEEHLRAELKFPPRASAETGFQATYATRAPGRYERRVNFAQIERSLDDLEERAHERLRGVLAERVNKLLDYIGRRLEAGELTASQAATLEIRGLGEVTDILREFLRQAYDLGEETILRELPRRHQTKPSFIPTDAIRWLSAAALRISQGLRARWEDDVRRILIQALQTGETPRETQRKLQDLFEPWLGDRTLIRDEEEVAPHRLEAILRTNATEAFNQGRLVTARGAAPLLRGLIYSAVIDSRTTPVCRFLDRKIIRLDDPNLERLTPPRHWNCRSVLVPVPLDMEVDEEDILTPAQAARALEMSGADFR